MTFSSFRQLPKMQLWAIGLGSCVTLPFHFYGLNAWQSSQWMMMQVFVHPVGSQWPFVSLLWLWSLTFPQGCTEVLPVSSDVGLMVLKLPPPEAVQWKHLHFAPCLLWVQRCPRPSAHCWSDTCSCPLPTFRCLLLMLESLEFSAWSSGLWPPCGCEHFPTVCGFAFYPLMGSFTEQNFKLQ